MERNFQSITETIPAILGRQLRVRRQSRCKNLKTFAAYVGLPVSTISGYESGEKDLRRASGKTLRALSRRLNCTIEQLITPAVEGAPTDLRLWLHSRRIRNGENIYDRLSYCDEAMAVIEHVQQLMDSTSEDTLRSNAFECDQADYLISLYDYEWDLDLTAEENMANFRRACAQDALAELKRIDRRETLKCIASMREDWSPARR